MNQEVEIVMTTKFFDFESVSLLQQRHFLPLLLFLLFFLAFILPSEKD